MSSNLTDDEILEAYLIPPYNTNLMLKLRRVADLASDSRDAHNKMVKLESKILEDINYLWNKVFSHSDDLEILCGLVTSLLRFKSGNIAEIDYVKEKYK